MPPRRGQPRRRPEPEPSPVNAMRTVLAVVLIAAAAWLAVVDWQATIGQGYAYRPGTLGGMIAARWPNAHASMIATLQAGGRLWHPVGSFVLALPVALVLLAAGFALWIGRPRRRAR